MMKTIYKFFIILLIFNTLVRALPTNNYDDTIKDVNDNNDIDIDIIDEIDISHFDSSIFGKPDTKITGSILSKYNNITHKVNPEELGTYLEGDILIPSTPGRNGLISQSRHWPNGVIPYIINGTFTKDELSKIEYGFNEYHTKTCIRFIPRTSELDYISIENDKSGCWSSIGKIGGSQIINLQTPGCFSRGAGSFMHELMHALGFAHEQNRYERDDFVFVNYDNIDKSSVASFEKVDSDRTSAFGIPYDYGSIVHYSKYAFSINGQPTIIPKYPTNVMGQRDALSLYDIEKIKAMYKCNEKANSGLENPNNHNNNMSFSTSLLSWLGLCGLFSC